MEFFRLLYITGGQIKAFAVKIKMEEVNDKVAQFYHLLQSPEDEPLALAKTLYDIVLKLGRLF